MDGWLARKYNMQTVLGTILDPAADKTLMTTLTVSLAYKEMLPSMFYRLGARLTAEFDRETIQVPLAVLILGRDVLLSLSAFYYRYISLPEPVRRCHHSSFTVH